MQYYLMHTSRIYETALLTYQRIYHLLYCNNKNQKKNLSNPYVATLTF